MEVNRRYATVQKVKIRDSLLISQRDLNFHYHQVSENIVEEGLKVVLVRGAGSEIVSTRNSNTKSSKSH